MVDPTLRFSSRAENYLKYRPRYPREVIRTLQAECGLGSFATIADVGSGTGALTELFLRNGNSVYAIEPNPEMRGAAEDMRRAAEAARSAAEAMREAADDTRRLSAEARQTLADLVTYLRGGR